jgi:uncharacterized protein (DUF736 family)
MKLTISRRRQVIVDVRLRMSYRRPTTSEVGSSRWRTLHYDELVRWLPREVVDSDKALTYVLLHGCDEFGTGWEPAWMSVEEARQFFVFLSRELPDPTGFEIVREVKQRAAAEA